MLVPLTIKKPLQWASNNAQLMCRATEASDCNFFTGEQLPYDVNDKYKALEQAKRDNNRLSRLTP